MKKKRLLDLLESGTIDGETYKGRVGEIQGELTIVLMEERQVRIGAMELEAALDFTLNFLLEPAAFWRKSSLAMKKELQALIFPEGIRWSREKGIGTAVINRAVKGLRVLDGSDANLAPQSLRIL